MRDPDYTVFRSSSATACGLRELSARQFARLLARPDELLWSNLDQPIKIGHQGMVVVAAIPLAGGLVQVAYKQYRPQNWWKVVCDLVRGSRAWRGWHRACEMRARGIATPRAIVAIEPRGWRFRRTSYLATEWIEGAENLHLFGWRIAARPLCERLQLAARCAESLGRLIGRMHAAGVAHRDLKGANLLISECGGNVATCVVDSDGVRLGQHVGFARQVADLTRLAIGLDAHPWVSHGVCLRFLKAYLQELPMGRTDWKTLWRAIAARSRRLVLKKRRRGQRVL